MDGYLLQIYSNLLQIALKNMVISKLS